MNPEEFNDGVASGNVTAAKKETITQPVPSARRLLTVTRKRWDPSSGEVEPDETVEIDLDHEINTLTAMQDRETKLLAEIATQQKYVNDLTIAYEAE